MNTRLTRIAVAALFLLTACGGSDPAAPAAGSKAKGPFEYKDALGKTVSLPSTPATVVAQSSVAAALWDAGFQVTGAYGELKPGADGKLSYQAGAVDLSKVKVVGSTYGEFDTEKYALMNPQLLIDYTFDKKALWYVPAAQSEKILSLAPAIAVPGAYESTDQAIETFVDLAAKLGADRASPALVSARSAYDGALKDMAAIAPSAGLKVVVMSPAKESLYVAPPGGEGRPGLPVVRGRAVLVHLVREDLQGAGRPAEDREEALNAEVRVFVVSVIRAGMLMSR